MHDEKALNRYEEIAYKELDKIVEKGELTPQTLALVKDLLCTLKYVPEVKKMHHMDDGMMESGRMYPQQYRPRYYDIRSYDNGYDSYDYGMSEMRGRNSVNGQYTSNSSGMMPGGYSMNMSGNNGMQPDMATMMQQLMTRIDKLEKK